jgi:excisionase family DNA binding protein
MKKKHAKKKGALTDESKEVPPMEGNTFARATFYPDSEAKSKSMIYVPPPEREALDALASSLLKTPAAQLVLGDGRIVDLPAPMRQLISEGLHILALSEGVALMPLQQELHAQEAADILNVPRAYLIDLLKAGEIPHIKRGRLYQIRCRDLMIYKAKRDSLRWQALTNLTRLSQEMGLYDEEK